MAVRYFDGYYVDRMPSETMGTLRRYINAKGLLAELTFYHRDFYKTRYIYGFGRTEDVPSGISMSLTGGYVSLYNLERPYGAFKLLLGDAGKRGNFYQLSLQSETFLRSGRMEDVIVQLGGSYLTRAWNLHDSKIRNKVKAGYTQLYRKNISEGLTISDAQIPWFRSDSLESYQRLNIGFETTLYTHFSLLGFRFAPFVGADGVALRCAGVSNVLFYSSLTGGIRMRNENLIFGTIEVRFSFIPQNEYGSSQFNFGLKQNLRLLYGGSYAKAPALIAY